MTSLHMVRLSLSLSLTLFVLRLDKQVVNKRSKRNERQKKGVRLDHFACLGRCHLFGGEQQRKGAKKEQRKE